MLDAHDYDLDGAQCGNSAEFHFDATGTTYLQFVEEVIGLAHKHFPVFGYIGIRFTPVASAMIAMQRYPLTASVEVATPRSRLDNIYATFWSELHEAARARKGFPHWGQEFRHSKTELAELYGARLRRWREVLADVCGGGAQVFSTVFTREKGLEPLLAAGATEEDAIDLFLTGLAAGQD